MTEIKKINLSAMIKHANKDEVNSGGREGPLGDEVKTEVKWEVIPIDKKSVEKKINIEKKVVDKVKSPIAISNEKKSPSDLEENKILESTKPKISSKISLSTIKSVKKKKEVVEEAPKKKVIKDEKTLYYESLTSKVIKEEQKIVKIAELKEPLNKKKDTKENIKKSINLNSIKVGSKAIKEEVKTDKELKGIKNDNVETYCEIAKKEEYIKNHSKAKVDNWDVFGNYESEYKKKESNILSSIKKLTKIADLKKLTKTNKVFVWWIITATIIWISFLFYIDPETHSLDNYKTSILNLAGRNMTQDEINIHQTDIINDINWKLNQNNLGWYQLDFEILVDEWWNAVYKFDWNKYKTKGTLDIAIQEKLTELKLDKIRNYLKNK